MKQPVEIFDFFNELLARRYYRDRSKTQKTSFKPANFNRQGPFAFGR